ncbi:MAG TPA: hypothetical protein VF178_17180 [Gemmatimonadaceae bacterium]
MITERVISNELHVEGPTPARYWGDQWLRVAEKILKGLNNALGDRAASLEATAGLLDPGQPVEPDVVETVRGEAVLLRQLVELYHSLTAETVTMPEPTRFQDVLPLVVRLHEHHGDLRSVQCHVRGVPDTSPVLVRQAAFTRCILVLLASAAGNTLRSGAPRLVTLEYGDEGEEVVIRLFGAAPKDQLLFSGEGSLLHAVRAALAHAGASVEGSIRRGPDFGLLTYEVRLPAIPEERRGHQPL